MQNTNYYGIYWKIISIISFLASNAIVRYLTCKHLSPLPVAQLIFIQYSMASILLIPLLLKYRPTTKINHNLQLTRSLIASLAILCWYISISHFQLAQTTVFSNISPLFTAIGAIIYLNERLTVNKLLAFSLAFFGAYLIGLDNSSSINKFNYNLFFPLAATLGFVISKLLTRKLLKDYQQDSNLTTCYLFLTIVPLTAMLSFCHGWQPLLVEHFPYLLCLGSSVALANYSFSKAYQNAEVIYLLPINFSKIIFGCIIGYIWFGEYPNSFNQWLGMALIVFGGLILPGLAEFQRQNILATKKT